MAPEPPVVDGRSLAVRGASAVLASVAVNVALLWIVLESDAVASFMALQYSPVVLLSAVGAAGATVAYGIVARRRPDPDRTFVRIAGVVLLLSFVPDLGILVFDDAATPGIVAVLAAMHVVVAIVSVVALTDLEAL